MIVIYTVFIMYNTMNGILQVIYEYSYHIYSWVVVYSRQSYDSIDAVK